MTQSAFLTPTKIRLRNGVVMSQHEAWCAWKQITKLKDEKLLAVLFRVHSGSSEGMDDGVYNMLESASLDPCGLLWQNPIVQ